MIRSTILSLLLIIPCIRAAAEDTVITHPGVQVASLSADDAKDFFLGRKSNWPDGSKVVVAIVKDHEGLSTLLGKSPSQFVTSWKKLVFTGKGVMPEILDNADAVSAFVAKTPGAIGYVDASKVGGCKAVPVK